jgi:hypothetical protein
MNEQMTDQERQELEELRAQALELGIRFTKGTKAPRLRAAIQAYYKNPAHTPVEEKSDGSHLFMTEEQYRDKYATDLRKESARLVRCRIQCMNPNKKNQPGEIISVGSPKMGTFKKWVPYNSDEPYHIPKIIYDAMRERKCRIGFTVKLPNGQEVNRYKLINEFAIEVLPPLSR